MHSRVFDLVVRLPTRQDHLQTSLEDSVRDSHEFSPGSGQSGTFIADGHDSGRMLTGARPAAADSTPRHHQRNACVRWIGRRNRVDG